MYLDSSRLEIEEIYVRLWMHIQSLTRYMTRLKLLQGDTDTEVIKSLSSFDLYFIT